MSRENPEHPRFKWHWWWAWYPILVGANGDYHWHWLEWVQRRWVGPAYLSSCGGYWDHRLSYPLNEEEK
jgi:hypothetical protein